LRQAEALFARMTGLPRSLSFYGDFAPANASVRAAFA
jgi:hypothetical protein